MRNDNFKVGIVGIIVIVAIIYFLGKGHGKTEMENQMYKQMYETQMSQSSYRY